MPRVRDMVIVAGIGMAVLTKVGVLDRAARTGSPEEEHRSEARSNPWSKEYDPKSGEAAVYYSNCSEARAAGAAPLERGEPGYRSELDRDNDGEACEPYYGG